LDGVLDGVTSPLDDALPISLQIGAVESECSATADTKHDLDSDVDDHADGSSSFATCAEVDDEVARSSCR